MPRSHSPHDYRHLVQRWRAVARQAGLPLQLLARAGELDLFWLKTPALQSQGGLYVSAGIHGDEPAGTEALIEWAEAHVDDLLDIPALILPCLNPWGLVNNQRADADRLDLNRSFHLESHPVISAVRQAAKPYQFHMAMTLHEDYDAQGLYLYEVQRGPVGWGEKLLSAAQAVIPLDLRPKIEGTPAVRGLIRRRIIPKKFARLGHPEAIWLHLHHADRTFTVETPSEFALEQRVAAHRAILEVCVRVAKCGA